MKRALSGLHRGQSLVLIAILMVVLLGMLTVVLDGGNLYFQRRVAQTAADAGALAGARELCLGNGPTAASTRAEEYACTRNGADPPPDTLISVNDADKKVTVTASIAFNNFIASIFGQSNRKVTATASAGCFQPCYAESVLPVVWSCQPPILGGDSSSTDCEQERITWAELQNYLSQPPAVHPELYVVMDSLTYNDDIHCQQDTPPGPVNCDFDSPPDGEADFLAAGGRSWVDLDGALAANDCGGSGEGSDELRDWIRDGYPCTLDRHVWIPEGPGNQNNVFAAVYDKWWPVRNTGLLVVIPVFDEFCPDGAPSTCGYDLTLHPDTIKQGSGSQSTFHIIDFAAFVITCVRLDNNDPPTSAFPDSCPGYKKFADLNGPPPGSGYFNGGQINNMNTIEGYFIEGIPPGLGGKCTGGVDTGSFTLYLDN
jgi:Flp pilus assembly protein TadG